MNSAGIGKRWAKIQKFHWGIMIHPGEQGRGARLAGVTQVYAAGAFRSSEGTCPPSRADLLLTCSSLHPWGSPGRSLPRVLTPCTVTCYPLGLFTGTLEKVSGSSASHTSLPATLAGILFGTPPKGLCRQRDRSVSGGGSSEESRPRGLGVCLLGICLTPSVRKPPSP